MPRLASIFLSLGWLAASALAWSPAVTTESGLRLELPAQEPWTQVDQPRAVTVKLRNLEEAPVTGTVRVEVIDTWRIAGEARQTFRLGAKEEASPTFQVVMGPGTYTAWYPIHATAECVRGAAKVTVHTVLLVEAKPPPEPPAAGPLPVLEAPARGVVPLARLKPARVVQTIDGGGTSTWPADATSDPASRAAWQPGGLVTRGEQRECITFHPPWFEVRGNVAGDYRFRLPADGPIVLETGLAIRDHVVERHEPPSDGVTFRVLAATEDRFETLFEKHTAAKVWDDVKVDLSRYAGRTVTLRLEADPGPKRDTTCDSGYYGNPVLRLGQPPAGESDEAGRARSAAALAAARAALKEAQPKLGVWTSGPPRIYATVLHSEAGLSAVAVAPGPRGLVDAVFACVAKPGEMTFSGFGAEVDGADLGQLLAEPPVVSLEDGGRRLVVGHRLACEGRPVTARAVVEPAAGAVRVAWDMPGVQRDDRGQPRYSRLALGPCSAATRRVYFGHGHVLEGCPSFSLAYGGFAVTTRYVGAEYENGLALVSATDPVPDRFEHDAGRRYTSLVTHHDSVFTFVPSTSGAFAAARVWRGLAGLKAAPGVADIRGKMCLDQWGGDYAQAAEGLRLATRYGLDEAVFVKHVWQRWGYDYRLPDIYPPAGDRAAFDAMAAAAKANGRLFCLHDNYIDFYPDATGFSYDKIGFDAGGRPRRAWYNQGRDALSYKWLPTALMPFLENNLKLVEKELDPSSYFIDVWSAAPPVDCYDRGGKFYSKLVDQASREEGFDLTRKIIGGPTISEAGLDALIGHLDAAQADHLTADPAGGRSILAVRFSDWDRVPWFDMGHHGKFVLLAGGLGGRYEGGRPTELHGYGSDDYLSLTILGGRTPMCDGPFSRRAVMTYWLLQPLCAELERQELLAHRFAGDDLHRQAVRWSDGEVQVNRGTGDWRVGETVLPSYGFTARAGALRADIARRDGVISAMSQGPGQLFADARPPDGEVSNRADIRAEPTGFEDLGDRRFRLRMNWTVRQPVADTVRLFVHLTGPADLLPGWQPNSDILFQAGHDLTPARLTKPGSYDVLVTGQLPEALKPGRLEIKYGLYDPTRGGARLEFDAIATDGTRYHGGTIAVAGTGAETKLTWTAPATPEVAARKNRARRVLDFGPVATNGAFRLRHDGRTWDLTLLPGSAAATVSLRLDRLGAAGRKVKAITQLDLDGKPVAQVPAKATGAEVSFTTADRAFRYRIELE